MFLLHIYKKDEGTFRPILDGVQSSRFYQLLDKRDEQMALLIQRVSGSYYGPYYMPCAAGVGYSYSPYKFLADIEPKAGMLRLVMGLGTSAVDRTMGSNSRLVSLDMPEATSSVTVAEKHQFSQRAVEAMDVSEHALKRLELRDIEGKLPMYLINTLLEHDYEVEDMDSLTHIGNRK